MDKLLNFIRGIVRPVVILASVATILALAVKLISQFGDAAMARDVLLVVLTLGTSVTSYLFAERNRSSRNIIEQPPAISPTEEKRR